MKRWAPRLASYEEEAKGNLEMAYLLIGQNLSDVMTSRKRGLASEYCSKWRQRCLQFGLLLETNFMRKTWENLGLKLRRVAKITLCKVFISVCKKQLLFGLTFSFKLFNC